MPDKRELPATYTVSVRELCEFTAKQGDLDLRFTPSPTAQEGIAGHARVASRRGPGYERELALAGAYDTLRVRGRADGYDADRNELEEIKTFRGDLERMPANHQALHWAQLKIYGALLCRTRALSEVRLTLVYFDIVRERETRLTEIHPAADLDQFFDEHCGRFLSWADQQTAHRIRRNQSLVEIRFPFPEFHPGQRTLAEAVYRTATRGERLMAQAPTGIGKTVGTLFPLLKACARQEVDKVFFLTAKTSGRQLALDAVQKIQAGEGTHALRVLELVARDKVCEHPDKACHGESCPLARGFYDRLPAARAAALEAPRLDQQTLRTVALANQVCPYYLSQELVRWCDLVVGDYNYYFDISALLHGLTLSNEWRVALLVDEAHNLLERGRAMYTASLEQTQLKSLRASAPASLKRPLDRLDRAWNLLHRDQVPEYQVYDSVPDRFLEALTKATTAIADVLSETPQQIDAQLQAFYFDLLHFRRMADVFAKHSLFDVTRKDEHRGRTKRSSTLCLRNVVPAPFLAERFSASQSAILFSATLGPSTFYQQMLGLPADTRTLEVESPFSPDQLEVRIADRISTRYPDRQRSLAPIAEIMAAQYRRRPGNYLAFFSSFEYLQAAADLFASGNREIPVWMQQRGMGEAQRTVFLDRFNSTSCGIGFAVLGGAFAEGIDLPGRRLIGAFVATLGLPQLNPVNEQMKLRMQELFDRGYEYTYLYPGLQKVVQAAGRVIRTLDDQGVLYLIDDRFNRRSVRDLLPRWWRMNGVPIECPPAASPLPIMQSRGARRSPTDLYVKP